MNSNYFKIKKSFILTIVIFIVLKSIDAMYGRVPQFDLQLLVYFGFTALYTFGLSFANGQVFYYLDLYFANDRFSVKRIVAGILVTFIVSLAIIFLIHVFEALVFNKITFAEFIKKESASNYLVAIIITFFVSITIYAVQFYKLYQDNKVKQQQVIAGNANAKFESLKNQIDPHFLFNSLNVLSSLIEENPENAQKFTTSLSKIYRYVLEQKDKELVTVAEELAFAKTYMNLLKMRFENSITFSIPENFTNDQAKVVPLSLQLLLENTIKHNIVSEQKPLHITIFIENNNLVVQNQLQKKEVLGNRKGVGLQNIVSRYAIVTQRQVAIVQTDHLFSVYLPILTKQITIMENTSNYSTNSAYNKAKLQVEKLKGFYGNLTSYCIIIPVLIVINLTTSAKYLWFFWPMFGWGIGVVFHALAVFGLTSNWEERKIQELINKNSNQQNTWK